MRGQSASSGRSADLSSSPFSGSSVSGGDDTGVQESVADEEEGSQSSESEDEFDAESTAMSMDDVTARSSASMQSDATSSSSSSAKLNEALRQAAKEAGTQAIDDDSGDMSMEIADEEITGAFQPWIKKGQSFDWDDISARLDQENVDPSKIQSTEADAQSEYDEDEELSMDVTNAIGRILGNGRRQSAAPRKSLGQETNYDDQTMEMTAMVGGISQGESAQPEDEDNEDEEMTMEFTAAVGGLLDRGSQKKTDTVEQQGSSPSRSDRMDFDQDNESDGGMDMEMTGAVGGILPPALQTTDKSQAKALMELESDSGQLGSSPFQETVRPSPAKSTAKSPLSHVAAMASEEGSPTLASVRSRPSRRSSTAASTTPGTPGSATRRSPSKKPATPSKQLTPQTKPTTPSKTPPSANVSFRSASPKKLFQPEIQQSAERRKSLRRSIFEQNALTGQSTPRIVLQPREARRSSGLGIDKEGLGSPRVAEILDRRPSLGDSTPEFVPQERARGGVRFEDPLKMQDEEDRDREEEELREDGHIPPLQPTDGLGPSNLRDMISSMSPKKSKIGSRKSLHVGAARGLLGKRPLELDIDEEEADDSPDPKRLRGRDVSPVKGVKLPAPSTSDDTSRRSIGADLRRARSSSPLKATTTPIKEPRPASRTGATPLQEGIDSLHIASDPQQPEQENEPAAEQDDVEPLQLQDFLNMTNIHFMELTTTKRRHTTAPGSATKRLTRPSGENIPKAGTITFDDCVAAGFCTVPMLELYQHSCRELKSYISEGRQVIRSIEAETFADNPPLFREYVTAPPDIRVIMDNQFRNVKTHARLLSKATWYEWRMKLLEGLMQGLHRHVDDMKADDELLSKREELLSTHVPPLVEKHASLENEASNLQQLVDDMENCDQDELRETRQKLSSIDDEIEAKKRELEQLQAEAEEKTTSIETGTQMREEYLAEIQEAEKVIEECRGWSVRDISNLKGKLLVTPDNQSVSNIVIASVHNIERQTGWSITSATAADESSSAGPTLCMSYRGQLQIKFHPIAFAIKASTEGDKVNLPLELTFTKAKTASPIASLVLKSMQQYLSTVQQAKTLPKDLLRFISTAWDRTLGLENEARMLEFCGVTRLSLSDTNSTLSLRARCTLLGNGPVPSTPGRKGTPAKKTEAKRIDVDFTVRTHINGDGQNIGSMDFDIDVVATKVYGFGSGNKSGLADKDMQSILGKGLDDAEAGTLGNGVWCKAVQQLTKAVF